jgi:hypothetical protein
MIQSWGKSFGLGSGSFLIGLVSCLPTTYNNQKIPLKLPLLKLSIKFSYDYTQAIRDSIDGATFATYNSFDDASEQVKNYN